MEEDDLKSVVELMVQRAWKDYISIIYIENWLSRGDMAIIGTMQYLGKLACWRCLPRSELY